MLRIVPQLTVADITKSIGFYSESFGFAVTQLDTPENPIFASLERGDANLFLVSEGSREEQSQIADLKSHKRGVGIRLYLEVDDAHAIYQTLQDRDVPILREIVYNEEEDYTEFSLLDPDGFEIGVYS